MSGATQTSDGGILVYSALGKALRCGTLQKRLREASRLERWNHYQVCEELLPTTRRERLSGFGGPLPPTSQQRELSHSKTQIHGFSPGSGPGRVPGDREDWTLGWRLLHLHQLSEQTQLLCRGRDCHSCSLGQSEQRWKRCAELGITACGFRLAQECLRHAKDYEGLLLLATASGNARMVGKRAEGAEREGKNNVAFVTYFLQGKLDECFEVLIKTQRLPEAALLAHTYLPSQVSRVVSPWSENLAEVNQKELTRQDAVCLQVFKNEE
ncbi:uncharacterized protein LOC133399415 [Phycodurus eques]|uniref:uncharacterized protein LOC133399415 n=1 Tax=Phycodurus eques TaxID=693459 RepID=UPI002ACEFB22|nr:uncharacterized protein LOC133399415 [Phycodurus eques]